MTLAAHWLEEYTNRRLARPADPDWSIPSPLQGPIQALLARSLAHFQLGESGDGEHLFGAARRDPRATAWVPALKQFIAEEKEHARLLAHLVDRLGGRRIRSHWTHTLFRHARRAGGLDLELQVLMCAELIGNAFYRLVRSRCADPVVTDVITRILADEARHLAFHLDNLAERHAGSLPLERQVWGARCQLLLAVGARLAWLDHAPCLRALGYARTDLVGRASRECGEFLGLLDHRYASALPCAET
jgi:hypothetical protein